VILRALSWLVLVAVPAGLVAGPQLDPVRSVVPSPDANGDYHWRWTEAAGTEREWILVPENKISPLVHVAISQRGDGSYVYAYDIRNGKSAAQGIHRCFIELAMPAQVHATPPDWSVFEPRDFAPRVGWALDVGDDGQKRGIAPGIGVAGFEVSSALLPGVTTFWCTSNADPTPSPDDLPPVILKQLERLPDMLHVRGQAIGPVLASPNGSFETLVARVIRNYRRALQTSQLSDRTALVDELDQLAGARGQTAQRILKGLIGRLAYSGPDPWSKQLAEALTLCLRGLSARIARQQ
jgi:hypothetical protein